MKPEILPVVMAILAHPIISLLLCVKKVPKMKITRAALMILLCLLGFTTIVSAHQPRLISGDQTVEIIKPEISQAFYAALEGSPHLYQIVADQEFQLYLNLLVPDLPRIDKDITATVSRVDAQGREALLFALTGENHHWEKYFEPFAGDRYFKGPERTETVPAGLYRIQVSSADNRGRYVLAVGKEEKFTAAETAAMIAALPALKRDFFEKSPLTAFFNLVGLFMLLSLLLLIAVAAGLYWLIRFILRRRNA
jgi:hypothetical protein